MTNLDADMIDKDADMIDKSSTKSSTTQSTDSASSTDALLQPSTDISPITQLPTEALPPSTDKSPSTEALPPSTDNAPLAPSTDLPSTLPSTQLPTTEHSPNTQSANASLAPSTDLPSTLPSTQLPTTEHSPNTQSANVSLAPSTDLPSTQLPLPNTESPSTTNSATTDQPKELKCNKEHKSYAEAAKCCVNQLGLSQDITDDFIKKIDNKLVPKGCSVVQDLAYRLLFNQKVSGKRNNYSPKLFDAISKYRPGVNGINHQINIVSKPYEIRVIIIPTQPDEEFHCLFRDNKMVLSEGMIKHVVEAVHREYGCAVTTQFIVQFKDTFYCPLNKNKLSEMYNSLSCADCMGNNRKIPKRMHTNFIHVEGIMDLVQVDFLDAMKFWPKGSVIRKQMMKSPNRKILTWIDVGGAARGAGAVRSENSEQTVNILCLDFDFWGYPNRIYWDNGSAFKADSKSAMEKNGVKVTSTKPRTPEMNGFVESGMRVLGKLWRQVINGSTVEQRETWGDEQCRILINLWFEQKFRKFGGRTCFEIVFKYPKDLSKREKAKRQRDKDIKELSQIVGVKHLSS
eukprot:465245_1